MPFSWYRVRYTNYRTHNLNSTTKRINQPAAENQVQNEIFKKNVLQRVRFGSSCLHRVRFFIKSNDLQSDFKQKCAFNKSSLVSNYSLDPSFLDFSYFLRNAVLWQNFSGKNRV